MEPPLTKIEENELLVRKPNISVLDTSTYKQLLQKKSNTFMMTWLQSRVHWWA